MSIAARDDTAQIRNTESDLHASESIRRSTLGDDTGNAVVYPDLWSAAFREAVDGLGKDMDLTMLEGKSVEQLFKGLEEIDKEARQESAFLRGVKHLHSLQVPLERFKLALDLANPLIALEPTAATVFGIVSSVTAVGSFHGNIAPYILVRTRGRGSLISLYADRYQSRQC